MAVVASSGFGFLPLRIEEGALVVSLELRALPKTSVLDESPTVIEIEVGEIDAPRR